LYRQQAAAGCIDSRQRQVVSTAGSGRLYRQQAATGIHLTTFLLAAMYKRTFVLFQFGKELRGGAEPVPFSGVAG